VRVTHYSLIASTSTSLLADSKAITLQRLAGCGKSLKTLALMRLEVRVFRRGVVVLDESAGSGAFVVNSKASVTTRLHFIIRRTSLSLVTDAF
jgi:hypothetical protein